MFPLSKTGRKEGGKDDIFTMRKGMWDVVTSRKHTVYKVFPYGENATEAMLYGKVQYGFKDGRETSVEWAARAEMVQDEGKWKFKFYQDYLVSFSAHLDNWEGLLTDGDRIPPL